MTKFCKEVCRECHDVFDKKHNRRRWSDADSDRWDRGIVRCVGKHYPHRGWFGVICISDGVPDFCRYKLEQIVIGDDDGHAL